MRYKDFFTNITNILHQVVEEEDENIIQAANIIKESIKNDGVLHVFGCGHSQMYAMELFYRAGGLVPVNAILSPPLSLAPSAPLSTFSERQEGLAKVILDGENVQQQDVMLIVSTSGRNVVPIEMAIEAKKKGLQVIALTSLSFSNEVESRYKNGEKLYQLADIVLDNHGEPGDAIMETPGLKSKFGSTSSIIGFTILQSIVVQVIENLVKDGGEPPIYVSSNLDKGDQINKRFIEKYRNRITCL
ncbi:MULTISPECIES: SIS domain-containing protein [Clostridia]|uniref:sugar isomerase domain-containing protein n=1 Tax=Clostridia TaxID=186801 RepID=UPI000EA1368A|nr:MULTISPECIES: SIS domain-containing protein [Clostridia]NBJ70366.1 sugar isomerase domain-containing protein [Roseburia sp. 1XD42-34]RKI76362.1 sugar isomerase domain-containing protein [Clostridium sp. 1xD42-85]